MKWIGAIPPKILFGGQAVLFFIAGIFENPGNTIIVTVVLLVLIGLVKLPKA